LHRAKTWPEDSRDRINLNFECSSCGVCSRAVVTSLLGPDNWAERWPKISLESHNTRNAHRAGNVNQHRNKQTT
jgi:hypothetical protein